MSLHPAVAAVRLGVRRTLVDLPAGSVVVVACSGGPDSLALLAATVFEARSAGWRVVGATIDHGLQDGSAVHAERVVAQMAGLGVDETIGARVRVEAAGLGPEAAARQARYAVLEEIGERFGATVLLGHTRDDQAETVLLGLPEGPAVGPSPGCAAPTTASSGPCSTSRASTPSPPARSRASSSGTTPTTATPATPGSGSAPGCSRCWRTSSGPGIAETLARTADQLRADMDLLDDIAGATYDGLGAGDHEPGLPVDGLLAEPSPIRRRVLRLAALAAGSPASELFHTHVLAIDALLTDWRGQRWVDLPGRVRCRRRDGRLLVERADRDGPGPADPPSIS